MVNNRKKSWAHQISQSLLVALVGSIVFPMVIAAAESSLSLSLSDGIKESADDFSGTGRPDRVSSGGSDAVDFGGTGQPGNQSGGGSRGECPATDIPLTVLMPDTNFGTTTRAQPTLWFYVPYTADEVAYGEFSLQTEAGEDLGEPLNISLPAESPGFVSLTLPESLALEDLDTDSQWFLELYCGADSSPVYVNGWLQQVVPTSELAAQLANEEMPADVAYAYATIWYDAIAAIAALRAENPEDAELLERWNALLTAEGVTLGDLPTKPFAGEMITEPVE